MINWVKELVLAAVITVDKHAGPKPVSEVVDENVLDIQPEEVPDEWEKHMAIYLDDTHPQHEYVTSVFHADPSDLEMKAIRDKWFMDGVRTIRQQKGERGIKWWKKDGDT